LIQAAVHVRDGEEFFFLDREVGYGSSLFKEKTTGGIDTGSPIRVPTVDLSKWLMENTSQNDYIILKLDVEGAEYDILEKMIADGSIRRVRHIFAEWHWHKIHVPESRHLSLQEELKRLRIRVVEWNAGNY
jgi:FkbM family methyltransferase